MSNLPRAALIQASELLTRLNEAPATLAGTGAIPFILKTGDWVYVEWDQYRNEHILVDSQ